MSTEDAKRGTFVIDGKVTEANLDELGTEPSPGKYKLPNGETIVVEETEKES